MSDELLSAAARVRELRFEYARAVAEDAVAVRRHGRGSDERRTVLSRIAQLAAELGAAKSLCTEARDRAWNKRGSLALKAISALARDDAAWDCGRFALTREAILEQCRVALHEPEGSGVALTVDQATALAGEAETAGRSGPVQATVFPALSPSLSLRSGLVASGILVEAPDPVVDVAEVEQAPETPVAAPFKPLRLPRGMRPVAEPPLPDPPKIGACGKRIFTSKHNARESNRSARFRFRAYSCEECGGAWHVANGDKR